MNNHADITAGQLTTNLLDGVCCAHITLDVLYDFKGGKSGNTAALRVLPHLVADGYAMENNLGCSSHVLQRYGQYRSGGSLESPEQQYKKHGGCY